jgi:hypothetical protein
MRARWLVAIVVDIKCGMEFGENLSALGAVNEDCHQRIVGLAWNPVAIGIFITQEVTIETGKPQPALMFVVLVPMTLIPVREPASKPVSVAHMTRPKALLMGPWIH